jgi:hypothetical protein
MERRQNQVDLRVLADTPPWDWPRDIGKIFHQMLTDDNADDSDRLIAAELAGDFTVINNELSDALTGIVSSADPVGTTARRGRDFAWPGPRSSRSRTGGYG